MLSHHMQAMTIHNTKWLNHLQMFMFSRTKTETAM